MVESSCRGYTITFSFTLMTSPRVFFDDGANWESKSVQSLKKAVLVIRYSLENNPSSTASCNSLSGCRRNLRFWPLRGFFLPAWLMVNTVATKATKYACLLRRRRSDDEPSSLLGPTRQLLVLHSCYENVSKEFGDRKIVIRWARWFFAARWFFDSYQRNREC